MAETFTGPEHQLNGKLKELAQSDEQLIRRAVQKFAKRQVNRQEVEVDLLNALGIEA